MIRSSFIQANWIGSAIYPATGDILPIDVVTHLTIPVTHLGVFVTHTA